MPLFSNLKLNFILISQNFPNVSKSVYKKQCDSLVVNYFAFSSCSPAPALRRRAAGTRCPWRCRCSASGRRNVRASSRPSASTALCLGTVLTYAHLLKLPWLLPHTHDGQRGTASGWQRLWPGFKAILLCGKKTRKKGVSGHANITTSILSNAKAVQGLDQGYSFGSAASHVEKVSSSEKWKYNSYFTQFLG